MPAALRKSGATFNAFGMINALATGGPMTAWFDDLVLDGRAEFFDRDPQWLAQNNRAQHDDYGLTGAHLSARAAGGELEELKRRILRGIAEIDEAPVVHRWSNFTALQPTP